MVSITIPLRTDGAVAFAAGVADANSDTRVEKNGARLVLARDGELVVERAVFDRHVLACSWRGLRALAKGDVEDDGERLVIREVG